MKQTRPMILAALFAALTALGAWIRVPVPPSAFTMQTFFTALAGAILGKRWGAVSQLLYLHLGLAGLPVFSFGGGLGAVVQPTFGFLPGMVLMAWTIGFLSERGIKPLPAFFAGLGAMYLVGLSWMALIQNMYLAGGWSTGQILFYGMVLFLPWDLVKLALAEVLCRRLRPILLQIL